MVALIANGPNGLEVPCMFFNTEKEAVDYLKDNGVTPNEWLPQHVYHEPREDEKGNRLPIFWDAFFKSYYGGCGDVDSFSIKEIEVGKPLLRWDLD
jgi:hypothetical protein